MAPRRPSLDQLTEVAVQAARAGGRVLLGYFGRRLQIDFKSDINLVTEADRRAERTIVGLIRRAFPTHRILAEESGAVGDGAADYRWLIDPLDGTTNFAHTFPMFCVSIGLERDGAMILGVVYDPVRRELWVARRGRGATLNRRRIQVSPCARLAESLLVTGFAYDLRDDPTNLTHFANFSLRARGIRRTGSAALDLCYTATGRLDGFWELKLQPWDIAAGSLIVAEAGGRVTDCSGGPFTVEAREIVASNGRIHDAMLDVIRSAPARRRT